MKREKKEDFLKIELLNNFYYLIEKNFKCCRFNKRERKWWKVKGRRRRGDERLEELDW